MASRRSRKDCKKLGDTLSTPDVVAVYEWPLGNTMLRKAEGEGWTDCIIELADCYRLGGRHNTRRVRYDGEFFITVNNRRIEFSYANVMRVFDVACHVYGLDDAADARHNTTLKGY